MYKNLLAAACLAVLFTACLNPIVSGWYEEDPVAPVAPRIQDTDLAAVDDLSLTINIPTPFYGGTPVMTFAGPQYTGTVDWHEGAGTDTPYSGLFASGVVYTALVTLAAEPGRTFIGVGADAFTHAGAPGGVTNEADSGVVTIVFLATGGVLAAPVSDTDLAGPGRVATPATNGIPVSSITGPQYRGDVEWSTFPSVFMPSTAYTATVTLTAVSGYTFGSPPVTFTHSGGGTVSPAVDNGNGTISRTLDCPVTADVTVTDLALTYNVTTPVNGGTPVTSFAGPQYTGIVAWGGDPSGFSGGATYTATVTLTAKPGWTFDGVDAGAFTHAGAATISNPAGSGGSLVVNITFPPTGAVAAVTITDLVLTYNVSQPVTAGSPVTSFTGPQYAGRVDWYDAGGASHTGLFHGNTVYKAVVTMAPGTGYDPGTNTTFLYTFTGVTLNSFGHAKATLVRNAANSNVVEITFPKTAVSVYGP
jgi:hypothetical protein